MTVLEIFRIIANEFADMSDDTVENWIELTSPMVSRKKFGKLYEQALALLTAHRLKMFGYGDTSLGTVGDSLRVGSYSEGEASVSFTANPSANIATDAELALTQYGLGYLSLRRLVIISISI